MKKFILVCAAISCCASAAFASEKVKGSFTAVRECDAYQSFRKGTNPGMITVKSGVKYEAKEINKTKEWNWIRVDIEDASPNLRWVSKECGTADIIVDNGSGGGGIGSEGGSACSTPNLHDSYVIAMTWQPGFCEHPRLRNDKPECKAINNDKLYIGHLTLHGLWPNKKECGIRYGNCADTPLCLEEDTLAALAPWMPNCYFANPQCKFADYEWRKHGTCQEREDDDYFKLAIDILQRVDKSEIGKYLKDNIGETIAVEDYRKHIETTMGKDVADSIQLICPRQKRGYLQEIRLNLPKEILVDDDISKMVVGANRFGGKFVRNCSSEIYIEASGRD